MSTNPLPTYENPFESIAQGWKKSYFLEVAKFQTSEASNRLLRESHQNASEILRLIAELAEMAGPQSLPEVISHIRRLSVTLSMEGAPSPKSEPTLGELVNS